MRALAVLLAAASVSAGWPSDPPFWPKYPTRNVQVLDGEWSFGFAENVIIENVDPTDTSLTPNTTTVPSVFDNAMPGVQGRRGTAFYRTTIQPFNAPTSKGSVSFAACGFYCKVWLDGVLLGDHTSGGYSQFWFDLPSTNSDKPRTLFVVSDNRFNQTRTPVYTGGDFWHFAGISRSVMVHEIPESEVYFQRVEIHPVDVEGTVNITVVLQKAVSNDTVCLGFAFSTSVGRPVCATVDDSLVAKINLYDLPCKESKSCAVWSFEQPNLTEVVVTAQGSKDSIHTRFGIRVISRERGTDATRLALNGKITKLKGYNRHTMYPDTGLALTMEEHQADMKLLKELGVNVVRGAHYPQDQRWLDLCDENGIAMWEECLGPGVGAGDIANKWFMDNQLQQVSEMMAASSNHPSVFFWGFFNEGPSSDKTACENGYKVMADKIHSLDSSRLVTWADNKANKSVCLEHADLVSFNHYPGWYTSGGPEACAPYWNFQANWVATNHPTKPFMISETGAGGVYEWAHNASSVRWSQGYQNDIVQADVIVALNNSQISSLTLWQFMDIKANTKDTAKCPQCDYLPGVTPPTCGYIDVNCGRPGGENHKGSVDFWRRKKQVFNTVASLYHSQEFGL